MTRALEPMVYVYVAHNKDQARPLILISHRGTEPLNSRAKPQKMICIMGRTKRLLLQYERSSGVLYTSLGHIHSLVDRVHSCSHSEWRRSCTFFHLITIEDNTQPCIDNKRKRSQRDKTGRSKRKGVQLQEFGGQHTARVSGRNVVRETQAVWC